MRCALLPVCQAIWLSVCLHTWLSVCVCLSLCLYVYISVCVHIWLIYLPAWLYEYLSHCLTIWLYVWLYCQDRIWEGSAFSFDLKTRGEIARSSLPVCLSGCMVTCFTVCERAYPCPFGCMSVYVLFVFPSKCIQFIWYRSWPDLTMATNVGQSVTRAAFDNLAAFPRIINHCLLYVVTDTYIWL